MQQRFKNWIKWVPNWLIWTVLITIALLIIIFNDAFGDNELFGIIAFTYFALVLFLLAKWIFAQIKSIIRLKNEKTQTELLHLKNQVNPHFFFNTLNNLYGLVDKDAKKAQQLILKLSDMMRYSLYEGQKETVSLREEIDYLQNYIALHKMRYHKTIDVSFDHQIEDYEVQIMPLLFIILLENAVKHGVENLTENAYVHLTMKGNHKKIYFAIENNFDCTQETEHEGIGLKNLKRRLEIGYPNRHTLTHLITDNVYSAQLTINQL